MAEYPRLRLYEEIALLALRDDKGTSSIAYLEQAIAGALLAELVADKRIAVSDDKRPFADLLDDSTTNDPLFDECLLRVAQAKRRARLNAWVSRFASIKRLHHRVATRLCERGILKSQDTKALFVFNRTVYPEIDHEPERRIIQRLENAIFSDSESLDWKDSVLVSLADTCDLLPRLFGRKRLKPYRKRIKKISEGEMVGKATREVIAACQTALIVAAAVVPVIAAGS